MNMSENHSQSKIDKLSAKLERAIDEREKANILVELSSRLRGSDPKAAMEYAQKALKISESIDYRKGIAISTSGIGVIHRHQGDYAQAIECYRRAMKISEEMNDTTEVSICLNNIGDVNRELGDYPEALILSKIAEDRRGIGRQADCREMSEQRRHNLPPPGRLSSRDRLLQKSARSLRGTGQQ